MEAAFAHLKYIFTLEQKPFKFFILENVGGLRLKNKLWEVISLWKPSVVSVRSCFGCQWSSEVSFEGYFSDYLQTL